MTDPYRRFHLRLCEHTGAVVFWQHRSYTFTGTLEQCEAAYRTAQLHNLWAGWWSVVSLLVMNWVALISNWSAISGSAPVGRDFACFARECPRSFVASPPGWYPDPSGPGHRYWDGARWTSWTNPPGFPPPGR